MTRKLGDQALHTLERRFQALRDQIGALPEACRCELEGPLQELSQAIASLRTNQKGGAAETGPQPGAPDHPDVLPCPASADLTATISPGSTDPMPAGSQPEATPYCCDTILHQIFRAIPDLLIVIDRDFNIIMSNWHESDIVPEENRSSRPKCYRVYHHRDRPCSVCHVQKVFASGQPQKTEKINLLDGRIREFSAFPVLSESGQVILAAEHVRDVTERRQAEEALRESEERFKMLFEYAPEAYFLMDLQGNFLDVNRGAEAVVGYGREDIIGRNYQALPLLEPLQNSVVTALLDQAVEGEMLGPMELNLHRQDGGDVIIEAKGLTLQKEGGGLLLGIARDITVRKRAEEALRESERRFRLMAETIQDVFWITTPSLERVIYVSPAYEQVWGRNCQDLYQNPRSLMESVHPEDRDRAMSAFVAAREQGSPSDHEYRIIKPDGAVRWIHDRGFPVRDGQGRVILFTGVARDVTEHKALEAQLLKAQKMEAVGRLAGGVAHDFNNLLMAITGYGELMRSKVLRDDPLYGHLENILQAGDRAAALTQQLLTFSRQKIVHPEVIDLNRVVLDLEPMLRRLIGEDLDLEVVTDRRLGAVKADPGQMGQVIMNLAVNSRDAMPQGGRLTLKTAPVNFSVGCHNRFGLTPPGDYVMLVVQDTGVGMNEATQTHIFEPFFTTKELGKGTGLGLSTVYGIVKQSGGYLDLESSPGAGSTFIIYLPRLDEIVEPPKAKIPITASFRGEETILLVEDEDMLRGLLTKFLRLYGYTVLEARHGGEALLTCERYPGPIHLMVTDVVMPQMSGRELADRLTPLRPEMQVLYMSGYTEDALVQHGVADLSVAFLQKPFRPVELARRVHAVLHPPVTQ
jgi:two-component system cell cycle sensor histidine kinase/response regulator CckA